MNQISLIRVKTGCCLSSHILKSMQSIRYWNQQKKKPANHYYYNFARCLIEMNINKNTLYIYVCTIIYIYCVMHITIKVFS